MNSSRPKYKPFFYSLFIHILLAASVFTLFYQVREVEETHCLIDLKSVELCSPAMTCLCRSEVKEVSVKKASTQAVPEVKAVEKQRPPKKLLKPKPIPEKQVEVAIESSLVSKELEEKIEEEREEEPEIEQVQALDDSKTTTESSVVTAKPTPSYEARYMEDNLALINALIKKNLSYPKIARKRGLEGRALVSFILDTNGEVSQIEASGEISSILKKSAIRTIEKASESFPRTQEILSLQIPIVYKLN